MKNIIKGCIFGCWALFTAFCVLAWCPILGEMSTLIVCFGAIGSAFVLFCAFRLYFHQRAWKKNPILPSSEEFEEFFWSMDPIEQKWYIDQFLKPEDLKALIEKYQQQITQISQTSNLQKEQTRMMRENIQKLNVLMFSLEFYENKNL